MRRATLLIHHFANRLYSVGNRILRTGAASLFLTAEGRQSSIILPLGALYRVRQNIPSGFTNAGATPATGVLPGAGAAVTVTNHYERIINILLPSTGKRPLVGIPHRIFGDACRSGAVCSSKQEVCSPVMAGTGERMARCRSRPVKEV